MTVSCHEKSSWRHLRQVWNRFSGDLLHRGTNSIHSWAFICSFLISILFFDSCNFCRVSINTYVNGNLPIFHLNNDTHNAVNTLLSISSISFTYVARKRYFPSTYVAHVLHSLLNAPQASGGLPGVKRLTEGAARCRPWERSCAGSGGCWSLLKPS